MALKARLSALLPSCRKLANQTATGVFTSIARLSAVGYAGSGSWGVPKVRALFEATYFAGLRKAGMPEE